MAGLKKVICLFFIPLTISSICALKAHSFPFFNKKQNIEKEMQEPMVHTVEEWLETATSVNMDVREEMKDPFLEEDKKIIPPPEDIPEYLEAYNVKAGSKELDLTLLNKQKILRTPFIASPDFEKAVYTEVYLYPQTKQIASAVFLMELDKDKSKKDRLKDASVFVHQRNMLVTTALPYFYDNFFSTLTVVDFSSDGEKILIKEKRGSTANGIYETYVWIYYITKESKYSFPAYVNNFTSRESKPSFDDLEDSSSGFNVSRGEYNPDMNSLKNPPNGFLGSGASNSDGNTNAGNNNGSHNGQAMGEGNNADGNAYGEGDPNGNPYDFSQPKLSYKDLRGFLTANWKDREMNSGLKSRWHNKVPDNYFANYDIGEKEKIGFGVRLNLLNDVIKSYWFDSKKLILNNIRWDLKPLGFSKDDDNEIIIDAYAYAKSGGKVSLGRWAVNINTGIPRLMDDFEQPSIEANAFWLVKKLNPRR